jgi:hypothetical protein
MRDKLEAIEDNKYQSRVARRHGLRKPERWRGDLTRSQRRDPEKVAEALLAYLRATPKKSDGFGNFMNLYTTRNMGVQDAVAKKALHLLNLRGYVSQAIHYDGHRWGCSYREDIFLLRDKVWL